MFRRLGSEDYLGAVALFDPGYVEAAAAHVIRGVRPSPPPMPTVEGLLKRYPDMPRAAAEYEVAQAERRPMPPAYLGDVFGVVSAEEVDEMTASELVARSLEAKDLRRMHRAHLDAVIERYPEYEDQLQAQRAGAQSQWNGRIRGHVVDGVRAYVVVERHERSMDEYAEDFPPSVIVLRKSSAGWRVSCDILWHVGIVHFHVGVEGKDGDWVVLS